MVAKLALHDGQTGNLTTMYLIYRYLTSVSIITSIKDLFFETPSKNVTGTAAILLNF
jgi:hypothetical protein